MSDIFFKQILLHTDGNSRTKYNNYKKLISEFESKLYNKLYSNKL